MFVLGLDIGGTKCAVTVSQTEKDRISVLEKQVFATDTTVPAEQMLSAWYPVLHRLKEAYRCTCMGISCGGPLDSQRGVIIAPPNLPNFRNFAIVERLEQEFGIPVFLQNDANACALAEWQFGAGQGVKNMAFLTFGTGLGAGLILGGRLYEGTNGNAGEIGHLRLAPDGPVGFGKSGSFEGFCSGGGIAQLGVKLGREAYAQGIRPAYYDPENEKAVCAKTIAEAAQNGDETARAVYDISGTYLGRGLAMLIDILNPEKIVIGSIFARSQSLLWEACQTALQQEALAVSLGVCEIVPAKLHEQIGDYAAATVAVYGMETRQ